ncbi:transposable element Tcb2 transposase [Trichonephila clavipes]|nr:transposable element Tcb2 transposase [Trichonephila clavipes]
MSQFVKYGYKKSPGRLHTWKNDRKLEEGRTVTSVAAEFGINKSVLSRAWKALQTIATGRQVLRFTVARRLHKGSLFAHRPERCLPLKVDHRRHLLQWCREHKNWTTDQWRRVLFTDESRFSTRSDSQRVLIWRGIGTWFYTSNTKERHHYGCPGVLVWRGIMLNGRTELHIFDRGSVIGDRYCEEVLLPHVRLFQGAIAQTSFLWITMHNHIRLLLLRSCWKVKISLEWIDQRTPQI